MTHDMHGHYADKHPGEKAVDPIVKEAVERQSEDGRMSCARAHRIARELKTDPGVIGYHLDMTETRIIHCQLGLFGYSPEKKIVLPADNVGEKLEAAIRNALAKGKLPCRAAWDIAEELGLKRMEVSAACEALGIKVAPCQLGAFSGGSST